MGIGALTAVAKWNRKGRFTVSGEFTVSGGAITAGSVKFKGACTVTRNGAGLFTFAWFLDFGNTVVAKIPRLASYELMVVGLSGATNGGWSSSLAADNLATAGTFQLQTQQQSFAAADPSGVVRCEFAFEGEAA